MSAMQWLDHVSKVYGSGHTEVNALRAVDLAVDPGEMVAIMGPSGSGKSTLLTIAGSLEEPTSGEVWVDGTTTRMKPPDLHGLRTIEALADRWGIESTPTGETVWLEFDSSSRPVA